MIPTPAMIAAAWSTWRDRHGMKRRLGAGPAFREAIEAALAAAPSDLLRDVLAARVASGSLTAAEALAALAPLAQAPDLSRLDPSVRETVEQASAHILVQGRGVTDPHRDPID